jgi:UDP-N-acetylglucosamine:LPS N-acetylglucosamine transferase
VVQNAGGLTSLEALASGVPVVTYRELPGHGRTNAQALADAGWAAWARDADDLPRVLGTALTRPATPLFRRLAAADVFGRLTTGAAA